MRAPHFRISWQKLALMAFACPLSLFSADVKDMVLTGGKSPALVISFSPGEAQDEYPLYFQNPDAGNRSITVCFLETQSAFPLGSLSLPANAPVAGLALKKVTTPSGKNFLGIEIAFKEMPAGELPLAPNGKAKLRIALPDASTPRFLWTASKNISPPQPEAQARPIAPTAQSAPTPKAAPAPMVAPTQPSMPVAELAASSVNDVELIIGSEQQDLLLVGQGLTSSFSFTRDTKDSLSFLLRLPGAKVNLADKSPTLPAGSLFSGLKWRQVKDTALLQIRLRRPMEPQAGFTNGKIAVTLPEKGGVGIKWKASDSKVIATTSLPESGPSAHALGETLDKDRSSLSSSGVFLPAEGGKPMILLRDSAELKSGPEKGSKAIKNVPAGAQLLKLEKSGLWFKVACEGDTGYLLGKDVIYADEMTAKHEARLQSLLAAQAKAREKQERIELEAAAKVARQDSIEAAKAQQALAKTPAPETTPPPEPTRVETEPILRAATPQPEVPTAELNIAKNDEQKLMEAPDPAMAERLEQERLTAERDKLGKTADGRVTYNSYGRRDPFIPVEAGVMDNGIDIDQMKVVGVVWHPSDPLAVLQHVKESSVSFTIKQGDPVHNGRVARITRDAVTFDITEYGISRSYTLKLVSTQERAKK